MKDYYELLEVNKKASDETIKKVFRMLIKKNHPDLFEGKQKKKAEERVKLLNEAYNVLGDKEKREKYDIKLDEKEARNNEKMEILYKENEYLKSVIKEKDDIIKEYLGETAIHVQEIADDSNHKYEKNFYTEEEIRDKKIQQDAYRLYQDKEMMTKIAYAVLMLIAAGILLKVSTGVSLSRILIEAFKNMF